jgi:2'-5' RNA ligase
MEVGLKASFILLASPEIHNIVRKLSWDFHQKYRTGTRHTSLPPHISLKQPFPVSDLPALEKYMDELAGSIQTFDVTLGELQILPIPFDNYTEYGILWISVVETEILRDLHNRINTDLRQRFGETSARFDGDAYHFHMTVMMGGQLMEIYRNFRDEIPLEKVNLRYTVRELALILYDEPMGPNGDYLCYRILPIGR